MPAYITAESVAGLSASGAPDDPSRPALLTDKVIPSLMRRLDRRTGQFFASGYVGVYRLKRLEITRRGRVLAVPRLTEVTAVETRTQPGVGWVTVDADGYETALTHPLKWSGIDTIELVRPVLYGDVRVTGSFGWAATGDLADDPVPPELVEEAEKQARQDLGRLQLGGSWGDSVGGGDLEHVVDGWMYLMSMSQVLKGLIDVRRVSG